MDSHNSPRVLCLSLPAVTEPGDTYLQDGRSFHLGLAYLAGSLRENDIDVAILDAFAEAPDQLRPAKDDGWVEWGLTNKQILAEVDHFRPSIVALSIPFSCQHYLALELGSEIKAAFPEIILIAGGNHVTACPELIDPSIFEFAILGEGELALLRLVEHLSQGEDPLTVLGVVRPGQDTTETAVHIHDLDALPFPALDLLPLDKLWARSRRWINIIATRGCVYDCVFCSIHTVMGTSIRRRSIDNIIEEINFWHEQYHIQEVYFEDDNLTFYRSWAKELFQEIARHKWNIRFYVRNGVRADTLDIEMLELMKDAGFQDIVLAPETGNRRILREVIGKKMDHEDYIRAIEMAQSLKLGVNVFMVIGFVEETWAEIEETVKFAERLRSLGCTGFWFSLASPYPGTRLYDQYEEMGHIPDNIDFRRFRSVDYLIQHPLFNRQEIKNYRSYLMNEFLPQKGVMHSFRNGLVLLFSEPRYFLRKLRYKLRLP